MTTSRPKSPQAGAIIDLARRALRHEQIPEIITTKSQQPEREKQIAGLFREGRAKEALDMKRADDTAEMVPGGYDGVVRRVATLYADRLRQTGEAPTISVPTNQDAHRVSEAVRLARRDVGLVGPDLMMVARATDCERNYVMPIAKGDKVRLFQSTRAAMTGDRGGGIGRNGSVLEVMDADASGVWLKARSGKVGKVLWRSLKANERIKLAYGDAMTILTGHRRQARVQRQYPSPVPFLVADQRNRGT